MTAIDSPFKRTGALPMLLAAGAVALTGTSPAQAQDVPPAEDGVPERLSPAHPEAVEAIGLGPAFEDLGLEFYGWVEQSFTFNPDRPDDRINALRVFDDRSNDYRFNQLVVNLERGLSEGNEFDLGGKIELMYGSDARFIHQNGLADDIDDNTVQFDPVQFYGQVRIPVGNGLTVKFGKYVTTLGAEVIDAPNNALYSHSYLFGFAIPFTHTGVQFDYPINDQLSVYYGLVIGWDAFDNPNDSLSHMAGGSWTSADEKLAVLVNFITGPEREDENTDYRSVIDTVVTYQWTEQFSTSINADYGHESGLGGADDFWAGVAGYATYTFNPQLATTVRAEYFRDATASRLGFTGDVVEFTAGLDIHPVRDFANLRVRPEVRYDHAFGDTPFDDGTDQNQFTVGVDVILTF